jgi:hypothetical protein
MITDFIYPKYEEFVGYNLQGFIGVVFVIVA